MRKVFIAVIALPLLIGGCVGSAEVRAVATLAVVCETARTTLNIAADLRDEGKLTQHQRNIVTDAKKVTDKACLPDSTVDPVEGIEKVRNAVAKIKSIAGIK